MKAPIVPRATGPIERAEDSPARARADLAAARARVVRQLEALEESVAALSWRDVVRRHPVITIGGAFLTGWAIARLFSRR